MAQRGVHFCINSNGLQTGEGYAIFATMEAATGALSFHKKHIGERYVEVFASDQDEMMHALPGLADSAHDQSKRRRVHGAQDPGFQQRQKMNQMNQMNQSRQGQWGGQRGGFQGQQGRGNFMMRQQQHYQQQQQQLMQQRFQMQQAMATQRQQAFASQMLGQQPQVGQERSNAAAAYGASTHGQYGAQQVAYAAQQQLQQSYYAQQTQDVAAYGTGATPAQTSSQGCMLRLNGLPWDTTPQDVLTHFSGYAVVADGVTLGRDGAGTLTGECWVTFLSAAEARRAHSDRNQQLFRSAVYVEMQVE